MSKTRFGRLTVFICLLSIVACLVPTVPRAHAQAGGALVTIPSVYAPASVSQSATCTTTACPTFILSGGMCTGTVRITGATTINVVVKVSPDGGTNYYQITPLVVGVANGTVTTNAIAANGFYSMTLATMNRVRFEFGTLTGGPASLKLQASQNCISQAL